MSRFEEKGVSIIGASPDAREVQQAFRTKYNLPFTLLADEDVQLATCLAVWQERTRNGKSFMGVVRSTFIIDETGRITKTFRNVDIDGHVEEVLAAL